MGVDEESENVLDVRIRKEVLREQQHARGELACVRFLYILILRKNCNLTASPG